MLIYGGMLLFGAFIMNFIAGSLPLKILSVRAGMGKKVIIHVHSMTGVYYRTGVIDGDFLIYRGRNDRRSEKRRVDLRTAELQLKQPVLFRSWGVANVAVDEATNAVLAVSLQGIQPHDAIKVDHLIKRALLAPKIEDKKELIIIILLVVLLLGMIYVGYQVNAITKLVQALQATVGSVVPVTS
jgi:hypothetical protein